MSILIAIALAAASAEEVTAQAREHFKAAQLHYSLGEFEEAAKEFRETYRLRQEPAILFNIAQCHRQMRQWKEAYFNYRQYLGQKKDAPNKDEAESLAEQMRLKMEEEEEQRTRIARNPAASDSASGASPASSVVRALPPSYRRPAISTAETQNHPIAIPSSASGRASRIQSSGTTARASARQ